MNAVTKASRAVIAEYAKKTLRPYEIGAIILFVIGVIGTTGLISQVSAWWWLLMIIILAYGVIGSIVWFIIHFTIDKLRPEQTTAQVQAVEGFIKQLDEVSGIVGLTKFGLLLRIINNVMRRRDQNVLNEFTHNSADLKRRFENVIDSFR